MFHYCCSKLHDRVLIFKYKYILKNNDSEFEANIGDVVRQREDYNKIALNGIIRDGVFEGIAINGQRIKNYFWFPLYKTVERHKFPEEWTQKTHILTN